MTFEPTIARRRGTPSSTAHLRTFPAPIGFGVRTSFVLTMCLLTLREPPCEEAKLLIYW
jgi:hypothetical protein